MLGRFGVKIPTHNCPHRDYIPYVSGVETTMCWMDALAGRHEWLTDYSGHPLIGESGFIWTRPDGPAESYEQFGPRRTHPFALDGYPLHSSGFWDQFKAKLEFIGDRLGIDWQNKKYRSYYNNNTKWEEDNVLVNHTVQGKSPLFESGIKYGKFFKEGFYSPVPFGGGGQVDPFSWEKLAVYKHDLTYWNPLASIVHIPPFIYSSGQVNVSDIYNITVRYETHIVWEDTFNLDDHFNRIVTEYTNNPDFGNNIIVMSGWLGTGGSPYFGAAKKTRFKIGNPYENSFTPLPYETGTTVRLSGVLAVDRFGQPFYSGSIVPGMTVSGTTSVPAFSLDTILINEVTTAETNLKATIRSEPKYYNFRKLYGYRGNNNYPMIYKEEVDPTVTENGANRIFKYGMPFIALADYLDSGKWIDTTGTFNISHQYFTQSQGVNDPELYYNKYRYSEWFDGHLENKNITVYASSYDVFSKRYYDHKIPNAFLNMMYDNSNAPGSGDSYEKLRISVCPSGGIEKPPSFPTEITISKSGMYLVNYHSYKLAYGTLYPVGPDLSTPSHGPPFLDDAKVWYYWFNPAGPLSNISPEDTNLSQYVIAPDPPVVGYPYGITEHGFHSINSIAMVVDNTVLVGSGQTFVGGDGDPVANGFMILSDVADTVQNDETKDLYGFYSDANFI